MTQIKQKVSNGLTKQLKILLILGGTIGLIMLVTVLSFNQKAIYADPVLLIREDSPMLGPLDAPVTLVEFLNPECVACGAAHPTIQSILEDYEGQIRYVVRYFPNHTNSILAVVAIEAAGEQGMYWEMLDTIFARQTEWIERTTPQTDQFIAYAEELGLDMETFSADLQNSVYIELAERDLRDAQSLNLRGTPTFFVNGQLVYGMQDRVIRELINEVLNE